MRGSIPTSRFWGGRSVALGPYWFEPRRQNHESTPSPKTGVRLVSAMLDSARSPTFGKVSVEGYVARLMTPLMPLILFLLLLLSRAQSATNQPGSTAEVKTDDVVGL
jgi:hypothetical protein